MEGFAVFKCFTGIVVLSGIVGFALGFHDGCKPRNYRAREGKESETERYNRGLEKGFEGAVYCATTVPVAIITAPVTLPLMLISVNTES